MCVTRQIVQSTGVTDYLEEKNVVLDARADEEELCAQLALADRALLMDRCLWLVGTNEARLFAG